MIYITTSSMLMKKKKKKITSSPFHRGIQFKDPLAAVAVVILERGGICRSLSLTTDMFSSTFFFSLPSGGYYTDNLRVSSRASVRAEDDCGDASLHPISGKKEKKKNPIIKTNPR